MATAATFSDLNTIAQDATFRGRCMYALGVTAVNVMGEGALVANHPARVVYATQVLTGAIPSYQVALVVLTANAAASVADVSQISTTSGISDAIIQEVVSADFNALAGIAI